MKLLKTLFIINPIAGTQSKKDIPSLIERKLNREQFDYEICFTERANHAIEIAQKAIKTNYDLVIAVGGDGTVNEVATGLVGSNVALGIIPMGSGNGLARHLQIPMNTSKAISSLHKFQIVEIDTGRINGQLFLCTMGVGLDAKVSHDFSKEKKRGFFTYSKVAMKNFMKMVESSWKIEVDGNSEMVKGLLLTIANANQYGNNVFIAPKAQIQDGEFDVCVLKSFSFFNIPLILRDLFNKTLHRNRFYTLRKGKQILIHNEGEIAAHFDGEPIVLNGNVKIEIAPLSLKVFAN